MNPEKLPFILGKKELQAFILSNENEDERKLVLRHKVIQGVPSGIVADQITGRRKAKIKLPAWYQTAGIIYPPSLNLEQSSSQSTAHFKASLMASPVKRVKFISAVDLTAGFGVDSFYFSLILDNLDCVEPDSALLEITKHNHALLGAGNIHYHPITAEAFLRSSNKKYDFVFVDPSRRHRSQKVFKLQDGEPDVIGLVPAIFEKTEWLLIKTSPLHSFSTATTMIFLT